MGRQNSRRRAAGGDDFQRRRSDLVSDLGSSEGGRLEMGTANPWGVDRACE